MNQALSEKIGGEKFAFTEEGDHVLVQKSEGGENFQIDRMVAGNFDSIDWNSFLPARIFLSPGIDPRRSFFKRLSSFEIRELDFFSDHFSGFKIGITGTDGKSTFTSQLGEVLKRAFPNKKIFIGGNLGTGMAQALNQDFEIAVLEVSSFQAERLKTTSLDFGIIINLAPDHLDRYADLSEYFEAKWNLLKHSKKVAYPQDVERPQNFKLKPEVDYENSDSVLEILRKIAPILLRSIGGADFQIQETYFQNLPQLPHRLEIHKDKSGALFVNDSKATTVHSCLYGLRQTQKIASKVRLIVGGRHKGDDFAELAAFLRDQDEVLICGEAGDLIQEQLAGIPQKIRRYGKLKDLLSTEIPAVRSGEALQLSPGCSSYDEFKNFEERGEYFIQQVRGHRLF